MKIKIFDKVIAGIDEVGRGCLAGPVVACCAIIHESINCSDIKDSKQLSKSKRQSLFTKFQEFEELGLLQFGIGIVEPKIIDEINILNATKLAMLRSYQDLCKKYQIFPEIILVDGNFVPFSKQDRIETIKPIIRGDQQEVSIATASILAKVIRDQIMSDYHQKFPLYGFDRHVGYATKIHIEAIKNYGILEIHRRNFEPVKSGLNITTQLSK